MENGTPRSTSIPSYLRPIGARLQERRAAQQQSESEEQIKKAKASGRLTTAQFHQEFPDALNHGHGNFEDNHTGQIWEVREGIVYRRPDEALDTILTALNDKPDMSDQEYDSLIADAQNNFGVF